ncbi:replication/maintenance protein RepL, partial [Vibrio methylphosphonaticus]|uniref:replication/maintenance protein RepL n=1 Tax=Vibrio methylphosphonaticus TaxID=2946866 RepID=UPI00202A02DB
MESDFKKILKVADTKAKQADLRVKAEEEKEQLEYEEKNRNFHQVQSDYGLRAIREVAKHSGAIAVQVLILLCSYTNYKNVVHIKQVDIQKNLNVSKSSVHQAIKFLIEFGLIEKRAKPGATLQFILNPDFIWRTSYTRRKQCPYNGNPLSTKLGQHCDHDNLERIHAVASR